MQRYEVVVSNCETSERKRRKNQKKFADSNLLLNFAIENRKRIGMRAQIQQKIANYFKTQPDVIPEWARTFLE